MGLSEKERALVIAAADLLIASNLLVTRLKLHFLPAQKPWWGGPLLHNIETANAAMKRALADLDIKEISNAERANKD